MPKRVLSSAAAGVGVALWLLASPALGQSGALEAAESAYLEVDFEGTRSHALAALRGGGHSPEQVVRIYQLLGISSSALGDEAAARDYFMRMLGIDPDASLDDSVPPRLRDPYLEARGAWAARPGRLAVEAGLDRAASAIRVDLRDPTDMARRVRIAGRIEGEAQYVTNEYVAESTIVAALPGASEAERVEYYVQVLDMHGNTIANRGTDVQPAVVGRSAGGGGGGGGGSDVLSEPWLWIVIGAAIVAGVVVGVAVGVDQRSRIGVQSGITIGLE